MSDVIPQDEIQAEVIEQAVAERLVELGLTTKTEFDAEHGAVDKLKADRATLKAALLAAKAAIPPLVSE